MQPKQSFWKSRFRMPALIISIVFLVIACVLIGYNQLVLASWKQATIIDQHSTLVSCGNGARGGFALYYDYGYIVDGKHYALNTCQGQAAIGQIISYNPSKPSVATTNTYSYILVFIYTSAVAGVAFMLFAIFGSDFQKNIK